MRDGEDVGIFATGTLVNESVRAARLLSKSGINAGVINLSKLNPVNTDDIITECRKYKMVLTVEEHNTVGGVGSIVSEALASTESHPRLIRLGTTDSNQIAGNYAYMMEKNGLTAKGIAERITAEFKK